MSGGAWLVACAKGAGAVGAGASSSVNDGAACASSGSSGTWICGRGVWCFSGASTMQPRHVCLPWNSAPCVCVDRGPACREQHDFVVSLSAQQAADCGQLISAQRQIAMGPGRRTPGRIAPIRRTWRLRLIDSSLGSSTACWVALPRGPCIPPTSGLGEVVSAGSDPRPVGAARADYGDCRSARGILGFSESLSVMTSRSTSCRIMELSAPQELGISQLDGDHQGALRGRTIR